MLVRLLVPRVSPGMAEDIGDEIEVSDADAIRMIEARQAEPVRREPVPEKAVVKRKAEKATK